MAEPNAGKIMADRALHHAAACLVIEHDASAKAQAASGVAVPPDVAADLAAYRKRLVQIRDSLKGSAA